ncbi:orotate phosphoribosyltransferase [Virgibacillus halophilus]|uniref:orotate phosphoribosyltransferase n=1 Tax=Tigheibacillus halophilus TaxID=361280 RepID=UPI00363643C6
MHDNQAIEKGLLEIKAVQINPSDWFTWTSGIKAPIYCDNRLTMGYPRLRRKITESFVRMLKDAEWEPDIIAGCATAGVPHAAWLADVLELPLVYVRSEAKKHGKGKQIEGIVKPGQKVLAVEDLISTGTSSIKVSEALREAGAEVLGVFAIFTYGLEKATANFARASLPWYTIAKFDQLLAYMLADKQLTVEEHQQLLAWRNSQV